MTYPSASSTADNVATWYQLAPGNTPTEATPALGNPGRSPTVLVAIDRRRGRRAQGP